MRRCAAAIARALVVFLDAVLVGCFLSCFRPRPRSRQGSGSGSGSNCRDALVLRDQVGEVPSDDKQDEDLNDGSGGIDEEELRHETNYLKSNGTISEIPDELQNESFEIILEDADECNNMSTITPATNCAFLSETNSSEGCISEAHYCDLNIEDTQDFPGAESVPRSTFMEKTPSLNSKHKQVDSSGSPFPTPLVLRDDMQTPGTIYTSHRGALVSGKRVQTRKQFIYPVLRPIENKVHMELAEGTLPSSVHEKHSVMSLSHWLKPSSTDNENQGDVHCAAGGHSYDKCSLLTERPVFVASDVNWHVENATPRLPKPWDGNGIPNTNTRYKEDKKVTWHATPFEERLLKVLSDGEVRPTRVAHGNLFDAEEKAD